jgi:hypothetical protein
MTDISVYTHQYLPEDLRWDVSPDPQSVFVEGMTLDVSKFTQAQHYPNGFIPSGTVLGALTTGGDVAPYLGSASDGTQTAVGILRASVQVVRPDGSIKSKIGVSVVKAFAAVSAQMLPFTSSNAAAGGYLDAAAKTDLALIHFAA